jgi:hypothetical protein
MIFGFQHRCHAIPENGLAKHMHMCFAGKMWETQNQQQPCPEQGMI